MAIPEYDSAGESLITTTQLGVVLFDDLGKTGGTRSESHDMSEDSTRQANLEMAC